MLDAIRSDSTVAFAGAGVSMPLGYPSWKALLDRLADETERLCGDTITDRYQASLKLEQVRAMKDALVRAEIFKLNLGDRYGDLLRDIFGPKHGVAEDIAAISRIPFQHILTTNYDVSIEIAHDALKIDYESFSLSDGPAETFVGSIGDYKTSRCIVHVHGRYDRPESIVLTNSEYGHIYDSSPVCRILWNSLPISRRCIFFGFSFSDEEITEKLERIFILANRGISALRHFALLPLKDRGEEETLRSSSRQQFGIEPVFFDPVDTNFSGHSVVVADIVLRTSTAAMVQVLTATSTVKQRVEERPAQSASSTNPTEAPASLAKDVERLKKLTRMNVQRTKTGALQ
jgi:SIR2-like domain